MRKSQQLSPTARFVSDKTSVDCCYSFVSAPRGTCSIALSSPTKTHLLTRIRTPAGAIGRSVETIAEAGQRYEYFNIRHSTNLSPCEPLCAPSFPYVRSIKSSQEPSPRADAPILPISGGSWLCTPTPERTVNRSGGEMRMPLISRNIIERLTRSSTAKERGTISPR